METKTKTTPPGGDLYECPYSKGNCSTRTIHRLCQRCSSFGHPHCWDCCVVGGENLCKKEGCPEPSMDSLEYEAG